MEIAKSKTITIREFVPDDAVAFTAACLESMGTVGKWMAWCHGEYTNEEATAWISICAREFEAGSSYDFGIFRNSDSMLIGSIAINQLDKANKIGNIGYWVRETQQNHGYALQAVELVKDFGFRQLQLVRLEIVVLTENAASIAVAEKSGAEFECIAKSRLMHEGRARAATIYSFTTV